MWTSFFLHPFLPSLSLSLSSLPAQLDSLRLARPVSPSQRSVLPAGVPLEAGDVYLMSGCWGPSGGPRLQQDNGPRSGFLLAVTDTAALFVGEPVSQGWSFSRDSRPRGRVTAGPRPNTVQPDAHLQPLLSGEPWNTDINTGGWIIMLNYIMLI